MAAAAATLIDQILSLPSPAAGRRFFRMAQTAVLTHSGDRYYFDDEQSAHRYAQHHGGEVYEPRQSGQNHGGYDQFGQPVQYSQSQQSQHQSYHEALSPEAIYAQHEQLARQTGPILQSVPQPVWDRSDPYITGQQHPSPAGQIAGSMIRGMLGAQTAEQWHDAYYGGVRQLREYSEQGPQEQSTLGKAARFLGRQIANGARQFQGTRIYDVYKRSVMVGIAWGVLGVIGFSFASPVIFAGIMGSAVASKVFLGSMVAGALWTLGPWAAAHQDLLQSLFRLGGSKDGLDYLGPRAPIRFAWTFLFSSDKNRGGSPFPFALPPRRGKKQARTFR